MIDRYRAIRKGTEKLCEPLEIEDYSAQPVIDVSPPKWHLGHTTWFFETFVLKEYKKDYPLFDKDFNYLFNSYYNNIGTRVLRPNRGDLTRPTVARVLAYRAHVDKHMEEFLETAEPDDTLRDTIELGLQHEQQHQELLLTDIKYILGRNPLFPVYDPLFQHTKPKGYTAVEETSAIQIAEGVYEIGYEGRDFCFDNEKGRHKVFLQAYEIDRHLTTNGAYLEFIEAGGYRDFNHWLSEGWDWLRDQEVAAPEYWHCIDKEWHVYTLSGGLQKLDLTAPVTHISYYEADAFARWKGVHLPTEFEWEAASDKIRYGERWEWTGSAYLPYPYYKKAAGAIGEYNGKFMVNQMVLRGASVASAENHCRPTYRNFFHPYLRWQFTGIRLAKHL